MELDYLKFILNWVSNICFYNFSKYYLKFSFLFVKLVKIGFKCLSLEFTIITL